MTNQGKEIYNLREENAELKERFQALEGGLSENTKKVEVNVQSMVQLEEKQNEWKQAQEGGMATVEGKMLSLEKQLKESENAREESVDFKKIVEEQFNEKKLAEKVVKVIKSNESIVRETVDKKKCIIVFGMKEKKELNKAVRDRELKEEVTKLMGIVKEENGDLIDEIEEFHRVGKFKEESHRPVRIKFKFQRDAEMARARAWKLAQNEETKNIWIRKDLNEGERKELKDLKEEAKAKNDERTEDQKKVYYWRVLDMKIRKWYLNRGEDTVAN